MVSMDDTQPNKPVQFRQPEQPRYSQPDYPDEDGGPGCLVWGVMGVFSLGLAVIVVLLAAFAGWSDGLRVAQGNATATRSADIISQCSFIAQDILSNNTGLVQRRLEDLLVVTPAPDCVSLYVPTATALYINNLPTATPSPTSTIPPTATLPAAETLAAPPEVTAQTGATLEFDPAPLLLDAQNQIASGDYKSAVASLEAIVAIDANYQKATVDGLLYQALTAEATSLYRTGGNLAEAILLTNRAEEYGNVGDLNFERSVASLYLDAQAAKNINYPIAIQLLSQVKNLAGDYRGTNGQLFDQYVKYGDTYSLSGDYCNAQRQYDSAWSMQQPGTLQSKRDAATLACAQGLQPTLDPLLVTPGTSHLPDPVIQQPPTPDNSGVAPIGQPGG